MNWRNARAPRRLPACAQRARACHAAHERRARLLRYLVAAMVPPASGMRARSSSIPAPPKRYAATSRNRSTLRKLAARWHRAAPGVAFRHVHSVCMRGSASFTLPPRRACVTRGKSREAILPAVARQRREPGNSALKIIANFPRDARSLKVTWGKGVAETTPRKPAKPLRDSTRELGLKLENPSFSSLLQIRYL